MGKSLFETLIGAAVLLLAGWFLMAAYDGSRSNSDSAYTLTAKFDRVDGLKVGSDVRVSGLVVGQVTKQEIVPQSYLAKVHFMVDDEVNIPNDSRAEIIGDGLLGAKYLAIVPGGSGTFLKEGEQITMTQSAISIESLIARFVFSGDNESGSDDSDSLAPEDDVF